MRGILSLVLALGASHAFAATQIMDANQLNQILQRQHAGWVAKDPPLGHRENLRRAAQRPRRPASARALAPALARELVSAAPGADGYRVQSIDNAILIAGNDPRPAFR